MNMIREHVAKKIDDNDDGQPGSSIGLGWWLVALFMPIVGIIYGISLAASNRVGPALAMWATSAIGVWGWVCWQAVN